MTSAARIAAGGPLRTWGGAVGSHGSGEHGGWRHLIR
jgi:hypothetical protein